MYGQPGADMNFRFSENKEFSYKKNRLNVFSYKIHEL